MTAEKLQDAIGLLPADLIAEADKRRQRKPKVILWKRYAAMAACFALVCSAAWFASMVLMPGGGATESAVQVAADAAAPAAAAPKEAANGTFEILTEEAPALDLPAADMEEIPNEAAGGTEPVAYSFETPLKPATACFSSSSEVALVTSREELDTYLADKDWIFDFTDGKERLDSYGPEWFLEKDLLLIAQLRVPEGFDCTVTAITEQEGRWQIGVAYDREPEAAGTAEWHILLELDKGRISDADAVVLIYE